MNNNNEFWKLKIVEYFGNYFSDEKYEKVEKEIVSIINGWVDNYSLQKDYQQTIFKCLEKNRFRIKDENKFDIVFNIIDKIPKISHWEIFYVLNNVDFNKIDKEKINKLLDKIFYLCGNDAVDINRSGVQYILSNIRKSNKISEESKKESTKLLKISFQNFIIDNMLLILD